MTRIGVSSTWRCRTGRPCWRVGVVSVVVAALIFPTLGTELTTQTDEGMVSVSAQLPVGTRIELTDAVVKRLEASVKELVPEAYAVVASGGSAGGPMGGGGNRGSLQLRLVPKDQRKRSSDQIAQDLRRQLVRNAGRHHPGERVGRQRPDESHHVGRHGPGAPDGGNSRRGFGSVAATRAGGPNADGIDARSGRRADDPRRRASRTLGPDRPAESRDARLESGHDRQHDQDECRRDAGRAVPRGRLRVSDHRPAAR